MGLSNGDKIIILVVIIGVAAYLIVNSSSSAGPVHNEGSLSYTPPTQVADYNDVSPDQNYSSNYDAVSNSTQSSSNLNKKFRTRDTATEGTYKHSSYAEGTRNEVDLNNLDKFFESVAPLEEPRTNGVMGFDETGGDFASYKGRSTRKITDEDKFNASELLPKEHKYDWFDDSQATPVANTHLINISRPQGVNTILSKRYGVRDVRGIIPNPRNLVSPWNMSSVEPDLNIKTGALC